LTSDLKGFTKLRAGSYFYLSVTPRIFHLYPNLVAFLIKLLLQVNRKPDFNHVSSYQMSILNICIAVSFVKQKSKDTKSNLNL
jgi:hypothetical protein